MSARLAIGVLLLGVSTGCGDHALPAPTVAVAGAPSSDAADALPSPGGSWTRARQPDASFIAPAAHLDADAQLDFFTGFSFFRSPWVAAPSTTTARDGLGPLFNAHSCDGCHRNGGRGKSLLDAGAGSPGMVVRVAVRDALGRVRPHPRYGEQVQTRSTFGPPEATIAMSVEDAEGGLRKPALHVSWLQSTPRPEDAEAEVLLSARVAPALLGMGLLESIPAPALAARADPEDADGDGISGRVHRLADGRSGRFGWKAIQATVREQTAAAFNEDLGITSPPRPETACTPAQTVCRSRPHGNDPQSGVEIPEPLFRRVVHFVAHIPPPAAGRLTERVRRGQRLFAQLGCQACHTPSQPSQAGTIWPYTDLLLHDMGDGLADGRPEGDAGGSEWRTPPLWGLGTLQKVSGHTTLLHDGRARDVGEAILWHGGEAKRARRDYQRLDDAARRDLHAFLNAI